MTIYVQTGLHTSNVKPVSTSEYSSLSSFLKDYKGQPELVPELDQDPQSVKDTKAFYVISGEMVNDGTAPKGFIHRCNKTVLSRDDLLLDLDDISPEIQSEEELLKKLEEFYDNFEFFVWPTISNGLTYGNKHHGEMRYRVCLPLQSPLTEDDYQATVKMELAVLVKNGILTKVDNSNKTWSQCFGLPIREKAFYKEGTLKFYPNREDLEKFKAEMAKENDKGKNKATQTPLTAPTTTARGTHAIDLSVPKIITKMLESSKGQRDRLFMQGGWEKFYTSQSEADLAFANDLAFWTGRDPEKMDTIFRNSALMRDKWDEKHGAATYGEMTINKAIADTSNTYQPPSDTEPFIGNQFKFNNPTPPLTVVDTDHKPEEALKPGLWTENYISDYLVERHGDDLKHTTDPDKWYVYSAKTGTWEADKTASVGRQARETIDWLSQQKPVAPAGTDPADYVGQWQSFIRKAGNASAKARIIKEAGEYEGVAITQDDFNRQPMLLNTPGKAVNLATGKEVKDRKKLLFDQHTSVTPAKGKGAKRWTRFLRKIFQGDLELVRWVQKVLGYAITGATGEQVFFIMLGEGQNGKSVLAKVIQGILGNYAHSANINTFLDTGTQSGSAPTPDIVAMDGKRFVFTAEPKKYAKLDTNKIRLFTGEDTLVGRDLHEKGQREFESHFKLFISANHMLKLDMDDYSIARRVVVIPFKFRVKDDEVDKDLAKELLEKEGPEILDWLLEGAKLWKKEGLKCHVCDQTGNLASGYPEEVSNAIYEYKTATDNIWRWIGDDCTVDKMDNPDRKDDEGHWESSKALYADYRQWCINNGEKPEASRVWGRQMAKNGFKQKRKTNGRGWIGIRVSEGADKHNSKYDFSF